MTTKHKAEVLADYLGEIFFNCGDKKLYFEDAKQVAPLLRTIPAMEAEIESLNRQLEAAKKLEYQKGYESGSALTTYNKPRVEALEAEIGKLKAKIDGLVNHSRTFSPF